MGFLLHGGRYLADFLEDGHYEAKVANVEGRQGEPDVTEVAIAVLKGFLAGGTFPYLA